MKNTFETKKMTEKKSAKEKNDYRLLSRRATAFERFAGEFADTGISYQNINGFILPTAMA